MSKKNREPTKMTQSEPQREARVIPLDRTPRITVEVFARGIGNLAETFVACERLEQKTTRKLTREEWRGIYNEWVNRPRG